VATIIVSPPGSVTSPDRQRGACLHHTAFLASVPQRRWAPALDTGLL